MESNSNSIIIPEFDGGDYEYWSVWMKIILFEKGYWYIIVVGYIESIDWSADAKKEAKENERQNSMALSFIQATLDRSIFPRILACVLA